MCGRCESASGNIEGMTAPVAHLVEHEAWVTRTHRRACPTAIPVGRAAVEEDTVEVAVAPRTVTQEETSEQVRI